MFKVKIELTLNEAATVVTALRRDHQMQRMDATAPGAAPERRLEAGQRMLTIERLLRYFGEEVPQYDEGPDTPAA